MSKNIQNFNISSLNGLTNPTDSRQLITINNSIKIPHTSLSTSNLIDNSNAGILLKDVNSNGTGTFYKLNANSITGLPELYFNSNLIITTANLLNEFETISAIYPVDFSNIVVNGGYINFTNGTISNSNVGPTGVGLRYSSNNTVQFRNEDTGWIDLVDITTHDQFSELIDVDVHSNPLLNNQYIIYNATSNLFVNANLAIINDKAPYLGGDLNLNSYDIFMGGITSNVTDNFNVNVISLVSETTYTNIGNYLEIHNADSGNAPVIGVNGLIDANVGLIINAKGTGDITLNADLGDVVINSNTVNISGNMINSIYRTSYKVGGYSPGVTWNIPISSDTILFNFNNSNTAGTYWANVGVGIDGQKLNLIFHNSGAQLIDVLVNFGTDNLLCGTGNSTGMRFDTNGQSSMLIYLDDDVNKWQILNTGAAII
jgi:hypothetical protein